ncbi:hypothetical protein MSG28_000623 [Choristoneura fumiferana]|uniref:Uncharacterized protein n=1 Tax=Choristoneura fumiferana TaxID=7141 RepID=A0ACC0K237_CHOFU|nr:hypothetical protein MSG28_000623 [Choristoneura fumiferana]
MMITKTSLVALVVLSGAVSALPAELVKAGSPRNSLLETQVLALLENLRELMLTGSDGVPILDPLEIEHLHVDEDFVGIPGARLTINQLLVKYASTFIVDRLSISLTSLIFQRYSVEFEAHLPILEAETVPPVRHTMFFIAFASKMPLIALDAADCALDSASSPPPSIRSMCMACVCSARTEQQHAMQ